jgi:branched-chain amino acid transport system permease protein
MNELLQQLVNGIAWGSLYALIALGYTMVYGVLRLINFAHGDVYMIGAMVAYYAARALLAPGTSSAAAFFALLVLSMVSCGALGFLIERLAYRPLRHAPRLTALITAIGVSLLLENGGQLVFGPDPKFFPQLLETRELSPGSGIVVTNVQILVLSVSITLMLGLQFLVFRTRVGTALRAVSYSAEAASLMGIDVDRVISLTFVLGSMLAGAAGVLVGLSNPKIEPLMGIMPGLKAFVAAVVGGIGNIPGAMAGGILMGLSEVLVVGYVSSTYRDAIAFVILIVVLLVRPSGLFGASLQEKV